MNNNYQSMEYFINIIKEFLTYNPGSINEDFIYSSLIRYNISSEQETFSSTQTILNSIKEKYKNSPLDRVQNLHFLAYNNGKLDGNEIKMYIPLDEKHIERGANELLDFIVSNNINTQIKFADKIRNDDLVIRVNTVEDVNSIMTFVNNNPYIRDGMLKVNPFLPNINGIGITMDNNYSYTSTLAKIINDYFEDLIKGQKLQTASLDGLNKYIKSKEQGIYDLDLKDIYDLLGKTTSRDFKVSDLTDYINNKKIDKYDIQRKRITDYRYYFDEAVKATYNKYPGNVKTAITSYMNGDAKYFTNDNHARDGLIKYVNPNNVMGALKVKLMENNKVIPQDLNSLIDSYLHIVISNDKTKTLSESKNDEEYYNELIRQAYISTYNKYGKAQSDGALKCFIDSNETKNFTNDGGCRTRLKLINENIRKLVLGKIDLNNLNIRDTDEIVNRYSSFILENIEENRKLIS